MGWVVLNRVIGSYDVSIWKTLDELKVLCQYSLLSGLVVGVLLIILLSLSLCFLLD